MTDNCNPQISQNVFVFFVLCVVSVQSDLALCLQCLLKQSSDIKWAVRVNMLRWSVRDTGSATLYRAHRLSPLELRSRPKLRSYILLYLCRPCSPSRGFLQSICTASFVPTFLQCLLTRTTMTLATLTIKCFCKVTDILLSKYVAMKFGLIKIYVLQSQGLIVFTWPICCIHKISGKKGDPNARCQYQSCNRQFGTARIPHGSCLTIYSK